MKPNKSKMDKMRNDVMRNAKMKMSSYDEHEASESPQMKRKEGHSKGKTNYKGKKWC